MPITRIFGVKIDMIFLMIVHKMYIVPTLALKYNILYVFLTVDYNATGTESLSCSENQKITTLSKFQKNRNCHLALILGKQIKRDDSNILDSNDFQRTLSFTLPADVRFHNIVVSDQLNFLISNQLPN